VNVTRRRFAAGASSIRRRRFAGVIEPRPEGIFPMYPKRQLRYRFS
jgi:hypothetical protein